MTLDERLNYIRTVCNRGEMVQSVDPAEEDMEDEISRLNNTRDEFIHDDITMACMDAVFEGGQ